VLLVEWGDTVEELLSAERLRVELTTGPGTEDDMRTITIAAVGQGWEDRFAELEAALMPWAATP
jgi:tRNA A37 threonylcarbamoyladenosine biosynthesis protein TsaE